MASRNAKGRMIYWKISYCKQLARCSIFAKLLFTWLIPNSDDLGRIEGDPEILKGMLFPFDEKVAPAMIQDALRELAAEELIAWYAVQGNCYIQFPNFEKYQKLRSDRTYKSDYPSFDSPGATDMSCHDNDSQRHDMSSLAHAGGEVKRSEENISCVFAPAEKPQKGGARVKPGKGEYTTAFEEFWKNYPRKIEKKGAFKAWNTRLREGVAPELLINAAKGYSASCRQKKTEERFIKHPATFLGSEEPYLSYADSENKTREHSESGQDQNIILPPDPSFLAFCEAVEEQEKKSRGAT